MTTLKVIKELLSAVSKITKNTKSLSSIKAAFKQGGIKAGISAVEKEFGIDAAKALKQASKKTIEKVLTGIPKIEKMLTKKQNEALDFMKEAGIIKPYASGEAVTDTIFYDPDQKMGAESSVSTAKPYYSSATGKHYYTKKQAEAAENLSKQRKSSTSSNVTQITNTIFYDPDQELGNESSVSTSKVYYSTVTGKHYRTQKQAEEAERFSEEAAEKKETVDTDNTMYEEDILEEDDSELSEYEYDYNEISNDGGYDNTPRRVIDDVRKGRYGGSPPPGFFEYLWDPDDLEIWPTSLIQDIVSALSRRTGKTYKRRISNV